MKQMMKSLLAAAVCCALLFTTACGETDSVAQGVARGRYVETTYTLPEGSVNNFYPQADGSLNLLLYDHNTFEPSIYNTTDFESWESVEIGWYENLREEHPKHIAYDNQGTLYVLTLQSYDEYSLYRVGADGYSTEQIPVDWYKAPDNIYYMDVYDFKMLANGDFLIGQTSDNGIVQYGSDGTFKGVYGTSLHSESNPSSFAVNGDTLTILDLGSVLIYDGANRELKEQMDLEFYSLTSRIYAGQNDILYVQNDNGLYRLNPGGSLWEKIIEGELCSMTLPGLEFTSLVEMENGEFYMLSVGDRDNYTVRGYHYDPDTVTLPEHELVVFTLEENDTVRLAAVEYQKLYPDTKIDIQLAYSDSSVTTSDLLRALNAELLNGKGPDILILDGMNVESYIDKGVLLDLSEMVDELTAGGDMVEVVLRTYEKDDRICALPVKYHLPFMIAEEPVAAEIKTLDDMARYAVEHPERGIRGDLRPETVMNALLPASAPTWVKDGAIDAEQLADFLEAVHTIMNTGAQSIVYEHPDYPGHDFSLYSEPFHYAYGRSHVYLDQTMKGIYGVTELHALLDPSENLTPIPEPRTGNVMTYLPGQQEKTYVPVTVTGVNINSAQLEKAEDFVKLMLSDSVQYDGGKETGFAVSVTAQEEEAAYFIEGIWGVAGINLCAEGENLITTWASVELQQQVIQLAQGVENPSTVDETLKTMIIDGSKGYLTGEKSLEQAIADVEEATKLYLAE